MASNYDDKKHQKYVQTENPMKKLAAGIDYIHSATVDNEKAFFINHYTELLSIINEVIRISEENEIRDKKRFISVLRLLRRQQDEKFYFILELLDRMLYHIPDKVNATTTRHTIQTLITQFLHPDHAHAYRIAAFDVLLRFVYQFAAHDVEQLLLDAIPKIAIISPTARSLSSDGPAARPLSVSNSQWLPPITALIDRDAPPNSEHDVAQFLDRIFHVSVAGLPAWIGSRGKMTFTIAREAQLQQFHYWRRLITRQLSTVLIGSKVVAATARSGEILVQARACRFHTPPLAIQESIDGWILSTMKKDLINEFWREESKTFVLHLLAQRFQRELTRTIKGLKFMSHSIAFYRCLLSLETETHRNSLSTISIPEHVTEHRDMYVATFSDHLANVFGLLGGGDQTTALQEAQYYLAKAAWELLLSILRNCRTEVLTENIRLHCYRIADLYSPQTRIPVYVNTTSLFLDALFSSCFLAPNWRENTIHVEFASKMYIWLTEGYSACRPNAPQTLEAAQQAKNYDAYQNFAAETLVGVISTDMQIKLCCVWRQLLFCALNIYCLALNASHINDDAPLRLFELISQQENDVGAVVGTDKMLWAAESYSGLSFFDLNTLQDVKLAIKILLSFMPLVTVATLAPDLHTIVTAACADVVLFGVGNCIVRKRVVQEKIPIAVSGEAKGNYKLAIKARARLEEQELSSALSALPVHVIYDLVASHLKSIAMDMRPCFKVSKLLAIDAICCAVTCRALVPLSGEVLDSCLSLIYNVLIGSDLKMYGVVINALEPVFTINIPNILQFLEPLWSALESTLKYYGKRGNHVPATCEFAPYFPTYSSPTLASIIDGRSSSRVIYSCNAMISSMIGCIYCLPASVGAPPLPVGSLPSNHRLHSLQILYHSSKKGNVFASLLVPMFNCIMKYIKHATTTELRILLLRTAFILFTHECHFGIAEKHENTSLCNDWMTQLCIYLADKNHALKLAVLDCLGDFSQTLFGQMDRTSVSTIIYSSLLSVIKESMTHLIQLSIDYHRSPSDEKESLMSERCALLQAVIACNKRWLMQYFRWDKMNDDYRTEYNTLLDYCSLGSALQEHKMFSGVDVENSRMSMFEFDSAREVNALPVMWADVAKKGGYTATELVAIAHENEYIEAVGDCAQECKIHFDRFGHTSGSICVPILDAKLLLPKDRDAVHLLQKQRIISLYPSASQQCTVVLRDKRGIFRWRVKNIPKYQISTMQPTESLLEPDANLALLKIPKETLEERVESMDSDVETSAPSQSHIQIRNYVSYTQLADMLRLIMANEIMSERIEKYLHSVCAEDSWAFLTSLRDFEATLSLCIEQPHASDTDLRVAELKLLYFQHFITDCDQPLNVSCAVAKKVEDAFEQLMSLTPESDTALVDVLLQLQSAITDAKDEIYFMLVQDKLLGFFTSMGRYGQLLLDLKVVSTQECTIVEEMLGGEENTSAKSTEEKEYDRKYTTLALMQHLNLIPQPAISPDDEDDWTLVAQENDCVLLHAKEKVRRKQLQQALRHFDDLPIREQFKFGVIYVRRGQVNQREILANTGGSEAYCRFIESLGTIIDLSSHLGFDGLMDRSEQLTDGRYFPYYSDDQIEVCYHVATSMPTAAEDVQQIAKKRHIGNDFIHIVYNEDTRDYNPNLITSDFGDVVIIVSPLENTPLYYSVKIMCKTDIALGPLVNGMIVAESLLPVLLRQTAVRANRHINLTRRKAYMLPHAVREQALADLSQAYGVTYSHDLFLNLALQG